MNTIEEIFIAMGGTGAFAKAIGVKHSTASEIRRRKSIPVRYWPALIASADLMDVSIDNDLLVRVHVEQDVAA